MYKKILAPLDGSEFSERSLEHVKAIASGCHVPEVVLFAVVEPMPQSAEIGGFVGGEWIYQAEKQALAWLQDYLIKSVDKLGGEGINAKIAVAHGKAADEILEYASRNKVDLIIMSTHGRSGVARWALGSVADKVVRHAQAAVLLISPQGSRTSK